MPGTAPRATPAIEVRDLVKRFRDVTAVNGISFSVPAGQVCALLGHNGAGKTTTLQILLGLTLPTSGTCRILGHDIVTDRVAALERTNFSASYTDFPARLSVREMLRVYAMLYAVPDAAAAVEEVIELFDLDALADRQYRTLSSGQATLAGLAKSVINRPRVLFLDEPTAMLDPEHAHDTRIVLRRLATEWGTTVLITSHNMREVERLADRVLFLSNGSLIADEDPEQLTGRYQAADLEEVFIRLAKEARA